MTEKDLKKENKATDKENEKQPLNEESMDKVTGGAKERLVSGKALKDLKEENGDQSVMGQYHQWLIKK